MIADLENSQEKQFRLDLTGPDESSCDFSGGCATTALLAFGIFVTTKGDWFFEFGMTTFDFSFFSPGSEELLKSFKVFVVAAVSLIPGLAFLRFVPALCITVSISGNGWNLQNDSP